MSFNPLPTEFFRSFSRHNLRLAPIVYRLIDSAFIGNYFNYPLFTIGGKGSHSVRGVKRSSSCIVNPELCLGRLCFSSSDVFLFCWAAFLSISLLPLSFISIVFLLFRPCLIHARMPDRGRAFVHGHTFLHSWSGLVTLVVGLLHGATFLSNLPLVFYKTLVVRKNTY